MCAGGSRAALSWRCRASVALKPRPWPFCPPRVRPKVDSAGAGRAVSDRSRSIHSRSGEDAVDSEPRSRVLFRLSAFRLHAVDADCRDVYSADNGSLHASEFMDALALVSRAGSAGRCGGADASGSRAGPGAACAVGSPAPTATQTRCPPCAAIGVVACSAYGARCCSRPHSRCCGDAGSDGGLPARQVDLPDVQPARRARPDGVQAGRLAGRSSGALRRRWSAGITPWHLPHSR